MISARQPKAGAPRPPAASSRPGTSARVRPHGLPRAARLLLPGEFKRVQMTGRTLDLGPLVVRVAEAGAGEQGPAEARLGLAISRRVGNAVVRNRVKRRVREWFRRRRPALAGLELVISGRPAAAALGTADVARLLSAVFPRLGRAAPEETP